MDGPRLRLVRLLALLTVLCGCGSTPTPTAPSTTFTASGVVRDQWGVESPPVPSATVTLMTGAQAGRQVITGQDGAFTFSGVPNGPVVIRASAEGFISGTIDVAPWRPMADVLLGPVMEVVERSFAPPEVLSSHYEQWFIPFTVGRRGPVTLRLSSNQRECESSYQTTYWAQIEGRPKLIVCPPGPLTVERTEVLDPGRYSLRVVVMRLGMLPTDKREMYLSYPR